MPLCHSCGGWIEFRIIGGRAIPLHESGGCSSWAGSSSTYSARQSSRGTWFTFPFTEYYSYTIPNATCPVCDASVFFYQSPFGGRVFFDELGPPWPKHPCTCSDESVRAEFQSANSADLGKRIRLFTYGDLAGDAKAAVDAAVSNRPAPRWLIDGWIPFCCTSVEARTTGLRVQGRLMNPDNSKGPPIEFRQAGIRSQFTVQTGPVFIGYDLVTHGLKVQDYFNEEVVFTRSVCESTWEFSAVSVDEQGELSIFYTRLDQVTHTEHSTQHR